jgi:hypothetical protein
VNGYECEVPRCKETADHRVETMRLCDDHYDAWADGAPLDDLGSIGRRS